MSPWLAIRFFLNGERFADRRWSSAPRIGDEVMLGSPTKRSHRVTRVVWGVENESENSQAVNVELVEIE